MHTLRNPCYRPAITRAQTFAGRSGAAEARLGRGDRHLTEQLLQRRLDIFLPGDRRAQFEAQARPLLVGADRLEADALQEGRRQHAAVAAVRVRLVGASVTERLDGPDAALGEVLRDRLDEHP